MIRPQPTCWFEIIVARDDAFIALEALAAAGCVEIEWHAAGPPADPAGGSAGMLREFAALAHKYRPYWPTPATHLSAEHRAPLEALRAALQRLSAWGAAAESAIGDSQRAEAQWRELRLTEGALRQMADSGIDFSRIAQASQGVTASVFAVPLTAPVDVPADLLTRAATLADERLILAVGAAASVEALARAVAAANGRRGRFPEWLRPAADANLALIAQRLERQSRRVQRGRSRLASLCAQFDVARALGDIARATWCVEHGGAIAIGDPTLGDVLARITGWTEDRARLVQAIEHCPARAIVRFPPPPRDARAPLVLRNPWWARPFEMLTRLAGMPRVDAADPSVVLAFTVPLLFGYMFGDVGQGLVLATIGLALRDRVPPLRLLVPCGLAAAGFGFVFGSVFCVEGWVHPWWGAPLERPLAVLIVPLAAGAVLLLLGLAIGLLEAGWRGMTAQWLRHDAPIAVCYLGVLAGLVVADAWMLVPIALAWAALGAARTPRSALRAVLRALGELIEKTLQILINTLSFARVGAFALAHAGLAAAVVALAAASDSTIARALLFVLGNALILAIEGLVVSVQTTRLVLFEFFTRFFRAEGREFRPLARPPVTEES